MLNNYLLSLTILGITLFFINDVEGVFAEGVKGADSNQTQNQKRKEKSSEDGVSNDLSPEIRAQLEAERNAFFDQTADLRVEIHKKKLAMKDELQKSAPDGRKLRTLQKEIAALEALLNKERYKFLKRMEKIHPEAGKGYFERGIMGND